MAEPSSSGRASNTNLASYDGSSKPGLESLAARISELDAACAGAARGSVADAELREYVWGKKGAGLSSVYRKSWPSLRELACGSLPAPKSETEATLNRVIVAAAASPNATR